MSAVSESGLFSTGDGEKIFARERREGICEITGTGSVKIISRWGERRKDFFDIAKNISIIGSVSV